MFTKSLWTTYGGDTYIIKEPWGWGGLEGLDSPPKRKALPRPYFCSAFGTAHSCLKIGCPPDMGKFGFILRAECDTYKLQKESVFP